MLALHNLHAPGLLGSTRVNRQKPRPSRDNSKLHGHIPGKNSRNNHGNLRLIDQNALEHSEGYRLKLQSGVAIRLNFR